MDRPAVAVDHAALERGVHLARRGGHHGRAHRLEEVAVHRRDADLQPGEVRLVDFLVEVQVEGRELDHPREVVHVRLFLPDFVDQVVGAVAALLGRAHLGELQGVGLGHQVGVVRARGQGHVDDAGLHRVADLEGRDRLRPADEIHLQDALAFLVGLVDPFDGALHVVLVLREGAHHPQRDFLRGCEGRCQCCRGQGKPADRFHSLLRCGTRQPRTALRHMSNQCSAWYESPA